MGYNNHSEVGWVIREYTKLIEEARELGIESPETHYNEGKTKGKSGRNKGVGVSPEGKCVEAAASHSPDTKIDLSDTTDKVHREHFLKKPSLNSIPDMIEKISMVDLPKFLYGFKLFHKK
ncbi:MAG: hypothetical protein FIB08_06680 [Candidatus Methanoperedens sp.]|nr:hypothetical protein [Candidatus Methanoperedens sp.]